MKTLREYIDQLDEISRRDFIKGTAATAGLAAVGTSKDADAFFGSSKGCEKYASKFPCDYVENKAPYDVYLWIPKWLANALRISGVDTGQDYVEEFVGQTTGLKSVRNMAIRRHQQITNMAEQNLRGWSQDRYRWSDRLYIGILKGKNGERLEKHRLS